MLYSVSIWRLGFVLCMREVDFRCCDLELRAPSLQNEIVDCQE
jgi:hypothetical protein